MKEYICGIFACRYFPLYIEETRLIDRERRKVE